MPDINACREYRSTDARFAVGVYSLSRGVSFIIICPESKIGNKLQVDGNLVEAYLLRHDIQQKVSVVEKQWLDMLYGRSTRMVMAFTMEGTCCIDAENGRVVKLQVDLQTQKPVPVDKEALEVRRQLTLRDLENAQMALAKNPSDEVYRWAVERETESLAELHRMEKSNAFKWAAVSGSLVRRLSTTAPTFSPKRPL